MKRAAASVIMVIAGLISYASAQRAAPQQARPLTSTSRFAALALSIEAESLPPSYAGMDCSAIAAGLKSMPLAKSEFETADAHDRRIAQLSDAKVLYGSIRMTDLLGFTLRGMPERQYDADRQVMGVTLPHYDEYHILQGTPTVSSVYDASNAFGAKTLVQRVTGRVCALLDDGNWGGTAEEQFPMPLPDAETYAKRPGILLTAQLIPPFYSAERDRQEATFTSPVERDVAIDALRIKPIQILYYDVASGRIYHRREISDTEGTLQVSKSPRSALFGWLVQVEVTQSAEAADGIIARLKADGYAPSFAQSNDPASNTLYRIRVGPFRQRAEADDVAKGLKAKGYNPFVTR